MTNILRRARLRNPKVNNAKLQETPHKDGNTYVVMPIFSPVSYGVEFVEEIKGHGKTETFSQKWPVCPYTVAVRNMSDKYNVATLHVDGQKVAKKLMGPLDSITFEGIPTENGIQELLFSLPRFSTLREKEIGGRALPAAMANEIGTVKIVWQEAVRTGKEFVTNHKKYRATSFMQANKSDSKASGQPASGAGGSGSGSTTKEFASTTRAGRVVGLNESRSCKVTKYKHVGEAWSARLCYRTELYLQETGVLPKPEGTEEEKAERKAKRARRRNKRAREETTEKGGAPCPPPVSVVDEPPLVPAAKEEVKKQEGW